jgi:hypothetical protein
LRSTYSNAVSAAAATTWVLPFTLRLIVSCLIFGFASTVAMQADEKDYRLPTNVQAAPRRNRMPGSRTTGRGNFS